MRVHDNKTVVEKVKNNPNQIYIRGYWRDPTGRRYVIRSSRIDLTKYMSWTEARKAGESSWEEKRRIKEFEFNEPEIELETRARDNDLLVDLLRDHANRSLGDHNNERASNTIDADNDDVDRIKRILGNIKVKELTIVKARQLRAELAMPSPRTGQVLADATVLRTMRLLRKAIEQAHSRLPREVERNIFMKGELRPEDERYFFTQIRRRHIRTDSNRRHYTRAEVDLLCALDTPEQFAQLRGKDRSSHYYVRRHLKMLIRLMFETGLRLGEACGLEWTDVIWGDDGDYKGNPTQIRVRQQSNKKGQLVPLKTENSDRVVQVIHRSFSDSLRDHWREWAYDDAPSSGYGQRWSSNNMIFPARDGSPRRTETVNRWLLDRGTQVNVEHRKSHALRRGFAQERFDAGMSREDLVAVLGHELNSNVWELYVDARSRTQNPRHIAAMMATAID